MHTKYFARTKVRGEPYSNVQTELFVY